MSRSNPATHEGRGDFLRRPVQVAAALRGMEVNRMSGQTDEFHAMSDAQLAARYGNLVSNYATAYSCEARHALADAMRRIESALRERRAETDWMFPAMSDADLMSRYQELARDMETETVSESRRIMRCAMVRVADALQARRGYVYPVSS